MVVATFSAVRQVANSAAARAHSYAIAVAASAVALLLSISVAWLLYREARHRIRSRVHLDTQSLFALQGETNDQLRQANLTLQVSEEKLAVTLNSIGDAVITTDAAGRVTMLNPLATRLTGWTHDEAVAHPVEEIFHAINHETRLPSAIPVTETLARGTVLGLADHAILV